ncbi:hypothetical protein COLO4_01538 [Corchorus olitorius]|uniref:Uncharacterized protein n=1 Tax=Corchorus olitorius TaxID=93759 RepID=A0A1R3L2D4_9ROSI|nr:hypothetical protein COLO4_01538 [Corchorus olitorius]
MTFRPLHLSRAKGLVRPQASAGTAQAKGMCRAAQQSTRSGDEREGANPEQPGLVAQRPDSPSSESWPGARVSRKAARGCGWAAGRRAQRDGLLAVWAGESPAPRPAEGWHRPQAAPPPGGRASEQGELGGHGTRTQRPHLVQLQRAQGVAAARNADVVGRQGRQAPVAQVVVAGDAGEAGRLVAGDLGQQEGLAGRQVARGLLGQGRVEFPPVLPDADVLGRGEVGEHGRDSGRIDGGHQLGGLLLDAHGGRPPLFRAHAFEHGHHGEIPPVERAGQGGAALVVGGRAHQGADGVAQLDVLDAVQRHRVGDGLGAVGGLLQLGQAPVLHDALQQRSAGGDSRAAQLGGLPLQRVGLGQQRGGLVALLDDRRADLGEHVHPGQEAGGGAGTGEGARAAAAGMASASASMAGAGASASASSAASSALGWAAGTVRVAASPARRSFTSQKPRTWAGVRHVDHVSTLSELP